MTLPLQAVKDAATDQNFRKLAEQFPIQPKNLANAIGKKFLKLVVPGSHSVNFGVSSLTWTAAQSAASKEIAHGLKTTPLYVWPAIKFSSTSSAYANAGNYGSEKFTLYGFNAPGALSATLEVVWLAIS